jgi:uncharacterized protein involved in outer membrane biogenesis
MKKWLIAAAAVVVLVVALLLFGISKIGPIIKTAVNTYGPEITRTELRLGDVGVSIFSGEATLKDFFLGNPKGFTSPQAMKVASIFVNVDEKSLASDTVIIDRIEIVRPELTYEKAGSTDNFQTIMNNVKSATGGGTTAQKPAEGKGGGKKLLIRDLTVKEGKVNLTMAALAGKTVSAALPEIHLKDVGQSKGGASPAEAFNEVFAALHGKITSPAVAEAFNKGLKDLGVTAGALGKEASQIAGSVKEEATKAAGSAGGKAAEKIKGLFGK